MGSLSSAPLLALLLAPPGAPASPAAPPPPRTCAMGPYWKAIEVPAAGLSWLPDEHDEGECEEASGEPFQRGAADDYELLVWADGPGGSGRYWEITVELADRPASPPRRGFCFMTTTVGWRTLQGLRDGPLPWVEDVDRDGRPELVVWASFPIDASESPAEQAIAAWAYDVESSHRLVLDLESSRALAREIAAAYRRPLPHQTDGWLRSRREAAARFLEAFVAGDCAALELASDREEEAVGVDEAHVTHAP